MANHRVFGAVQEKQIIDMYLEGQSVPTIAKAIGGAFETVRVSLIRAGVPLRSRTRKYISATTLKEMISMYEGGSSYDQIAKTLGLSWPLVSQRLKEAGVPARPAGFRKGEDHHAWVGGRTTNGDGYVLVRIYPEDPFFCMAQKREDGIYYVFEHRLVMAKKLGRPLFDYETVHHKNLNHADNAESNLQLRVGNHGKGAVFQCIDCGSHNIEAVELQ